MHRLEQAPLLNPVAGMYTDRVYTMNGNSQEHQKNRRRVVCILANNASLFVQQRLTYFTCVLCYLRALLSACFVIGPRGCRATIQSRNPLSYYLYYQASACLRVCVRTYVCVCVCWGFANTWARQRIHI